MPAYPLRALVLRKTKLGETDLILNLLAADGRQVRAVAKGARKPKSRLGARTEPFTVADLLLHSGRSLEIIAEAETVSSHDGLRSDYDRATAAAVVADVLDKTSVEGQAEPQLFDMALVTLDVMETAPLQALPGLVVAFLLKALAMLGYRPTLDSCASCANALGERFRFSAAAGGFVCDGCGGPESIPVSAPVRSLVGVLLRSRMSEIAGMDLDRADVEEALRLARGYLSFHIAARFKALDAYVASSRASL
jgi:DNA repair protein RecO (recombination protein O)